MLVIKYFMKAAVCALPKCLSSWYSHYKLKETHPTQLPEWSQEAANRTPYLYSIYFHARTCRLQHPEAAHVFIFFLLIPNCFQ